MNKNFILYAAILIFGLAAPFLFPAFKVQLSILCVLIVLATTWNIQGGEMGYNSFGNILFYGLGMYLCASVQVGMFFPLAEWTESGGEKTFVHTPTQFFQGMAVGLVVAAVVPTIVAGLIGYSILGLRGHYFAICTLGLGVAAGEISGGIEIIGAGQGFTTPPFPNVGSLEARGEFFYFLSFFTLVLTFIAVRSIYSTRFKLILNAIRDNEDKAEAMGIETMKYKIIGWMISAFFCGLAGGIMGGLVGYIDSTDVAFDGREMGVFMNTPISLPSNATSVESMYPTKPPIIPPANPQKKAEIIQPIILYFIVSIPIASALSSLSLIALSINLNLVE